MINEASFEQYDWKNGSLTGKGLIKMIEDSNTSKQNTLNAPIKIYDRNSRRYFNIVDSNLGKKNTGLVLQIDTAKETALDEADDREPLSHALDLVGIKASTANSKSQDAVEMSVVEDELDKKIDADIEEAMKEIYK